MILDRLFNLPTTIYCHIYLLVRHQVNVWKDMCSLNGQKSRRTSAIVRNQYSSLEERALFLIKDPSKLNPDGPSSEFTIDRRESHLTVRPQPCRIFRGFRMYRTGGISYEKDIL